MRIERLGEQTQSGRPQERSGIPSRRENFTPEEIKLIEPFVTNMDRSVFALRNLPQVVAGTLFSRYSRTDKTLRQVLLTEYVQHEDIGAALERMKSEQTVQEILNVERAKDFYRRILAGYGDDSIGDLGFAHLATEDVSNIAAKEIEHPRVGLAFLEKSSRFVFFNERVDGRHAYYREPEIMGSQFAEDYEETLDYLFETYSASIEPMMAYLRSIKPLEEFEVPVDGERVPYKDLPDEDKKSAQFAYRFWNRSTAADAVRGLLPAATLTNIGIAGDGRAFEYFLVKSYASDYPEMRELAPLMHHELEQIVPGFLDRANDGKGEIFHEFLQSRREETRRIAEELLESIVPERDGKVRLVDYDPEGEEKVLGLMLYPHSQHPLTQLTKAIKEMAPEEKRRIMEAYCSGRINRRHKPGRALEGTYYLFDLEGNFGIFRDLQRHRMLTQERQLLTCDLGYDVSPLVVEAGLEEPYKEVMERAADLYYRVKKFNPVAAQYVVPFGFNIRWYMQMNLREAFHLIELRTIKEAHPDYAVICQEMYRQIESVHPNLARFMSFVDLSPRREASGRFDSAMRTQEKLRKLGEG